MERVGGREDLKDLMGKIREAQGINTLENFFYIRGVNIQGLLDPLYSYK